MKRLIIIFGLIYFAYSKPSDQFVDYTDDEIQNDENYAEVYREEPGEVVSEENNVPKVEHPVSISTKGETFTRVENETVVLPCKITGDDYVRVWRRHGAVLYQGLITMGAKENMRLIDGDLEISNLQQADADDYECMAMISEKNRPTIKHTIILHTPPRIKQLIAKDNKTELRSGETLTLICEAEGKPEPIISWHKGSERLPMTGNVLTIEEVKHHNAGEYKCFADNKIGKPSFKVIHIKVEYKPIVTIDQLTVSSVKEEDTELKCTVHGEPTPQVVWKKDDANIKKNPHTEISTMKNVHILLIKNISSSDFGVYTCSAVNYLGTTDRTVKLVKTPAVIRFIKPRNDTRDVVLTWQVQSKSPISEHDLQYRKKGGSDWHLIKPEISSAENDVYTVKYVLSGLDPVVYETRIRSMNEHGWSEFSEIEPFDGVYTKHGHHKKGRKNHKDTKGAQEVTKATQTVKSLDIEEPAEHQENVTFKDASTGATEEISSASTSRSMLAYVSVALIVVLHIRTPIIRL